MAQLINHAQLSFFPSLSLSFSILGSSHCCSVGWAATDKNSIVNLTLLFVTCYAHTRTLAPAHAHSHTYTHREVFYVPFPLGLASFDYLNSCLPCTRPSGLAL